MTQNAATLAADGFNQDLFIKQIEGILVLFKSIDLN